MPNLKPMYPGIAFSPQATLAKSINESDTVIYLTSTAGLPEGPNLLTIGTDEEAETILYAVKLADSISGCTRGVEGAAKPWQAGELAGRNFTNVDYDTLAKNIAALNTSKQEAQEGKGLSTNDYTNEEKQALQDAGKTAGEAKTAAQAAGEAAKSAQSTANAAGATASAAASAAETANTKNTAQDREIETIKSAIVILQKNKLDISQNAGFCNSICRGKNLGAAATAEQYAAISSGTFEDIFVGDYWEIGGRIFRIGGANYFLNTGLTQITKNHLVIVPDYTLYNQRMNATNTTEGGYAGSEMDKTGLEQAKQIINAAFPGHVLPINLYLTNAVTNGKVSAGAWFTREVFLMNEQMVYGGSIFTPSPGGTDDNTGLYRTDKSQLPLFQHRPNLITAVNQSGSRNSYWLRDVLSPSRFAIVNNNGNAYRLPASYANGVRPAFCIS